MLTHALGLLVIFDQSTQDVEPLLRLNCPHLTAAGQGARHADESLYIASSGIADFYRDAR